MHDTSTADHRNTTMVKIPTFFIKDDTASGRYKKFDIVTTTYTFSDKPVGIGKPFWFH